MAGIFCVLFLIVSVTYFCYISLSKLFFKSLIIRETLFTVHDFEGDIYPPEDGHCSSSGPFRL